MRSQVLVELPPAGHPSPAEDLPPTVEYPRWLYEVHDLSLKTLRAREKAVKASLPHDPRSWSREDVHRWLHHVSEAHQLPRVFPERFLMNGKALCLMTLDMFVQRVPLGGKLLYKDFQLRLCNAMYA
ncbi:ETS-domain lacking [Oratosquilla oratoria]|uniref:ETS-domain lacking n=1 Tax=Oratosquilla oratoria TaxID=337810 RepID=UPI003F76A89C